MNKIIYPFRKFFRRCKNIIRWFPTLWKDEDWDDSYIVEILVKKLEHQRDFFLSDRAYALEAEKIAAEIQKAIDGLRKTADSWEHYESPAQEELNKKWGEGIWRFEPVPEKPDLHEVHIDYPNVKTQEDKEQYRKEFNDTHELAIRRYKKDKKAVYQYIANNIDKWWD